MNVGALHMQVEGLVLLNSAGPIDAGFSIQKWEEQARTKTAPPKWIVQVCVHPFCLICVCRASLENPGACECIFMCCLPHKLFVTSPTSHEQKGPQAPCPLQAPITMIYDGWHKTAFKFTRTVTCRTNGCLAMLLTLARVCMCLLLSCSL